MLSAMRAYQRRTLAADALIASTYLAGTRIGVTAVLHTWGSALTPTLPSTIHRPPCRLNKLSCIGARS
jgi:hypothetical protein